MAATANEASQRRCATPRTLSQVEVEHVLHHLHPLALYPLAGGILWVAALGCGGSSGTAAEPNGQSLPSEASRETPRGVQRNVGLSGDVEAKGLEGAALPPDLGAPRVAIEDGALLGAVSGQV